MHRRSVCFFLFAWLSLLTLPSLAQPPAAALHEAREMIFAARYDEAVQAMQTYLERTNLSAADRNLGLEVLATAQIAEDANDAARATLEQLYQRDPGHRLSDPDASPRVLSAFARAREANPSPITVSLEHRPPQLEIRAPPTIEVRVNEGADAVQEIRLHYRLRGEGESRALMTHREDGSYFARIPLVGATAHAVDVAYHIIALAPSNVPLAEIGSEATPLQVRIPAHTEPTPTNITPPTVRVNDAPPTDAPISNNDESVVEQWWFWTLLAAVVVGGAVTTGVLLSPESQGPSEGTLGTGRLMLLEFP